MKKISIVFAMFTTALICVSAVGSSYKPDYAHSSVTFVIKNAGINVEGKFKEFTCDIHFTPELSEAGSVQVNINAGSIDTGIEARDKHLRKEEFFNAEAYPSITFVSNSIVKSLAGNYIAIGNLTIKGVTKPVKVPFTFTPSASGGVFKGYLTLNRLDYGVGGKSLIMADELKAEFSVAAVKSI